MEADICHLAHGLCLEFNSEAGSMPRWETWECIVLCLESNSEAGSINESLRLNISQLCLESNSEAGSIAACKTL
ncbi:MAG: hypothetical protein RLZZ399_2716 [Verrucomicrobiota bacterium]